MHFILTRTPKALCVKDQVVNMPGFVGHILLVTRTQLNVAEKQP